MDQSKTNADLIVMIRNGDFSQFRKYYDEAKSEFIETFKSEYELNTFQAEDLYRKTLMAFLKTVFDNHTPTITLSPPQLFLKIGRKIMAEDYSEDDNLGDILFLEEIKKEVRNIESISEKSIAAQKSLDEKCKKLLILIYYAKFPLSKTVELMGLENLEELDEFIKGCKSLIKDSLK